MTRWSWRSVFGISGSRRSASAAAHVTTEPADEAGPEFAEYLKQLSQEQDARKASIEQRGLAVITTSGTLVTLLFGFVALLTKAANYELPRQASGPLAVALVAFVVAAILALLSNLPLSYKGADLTDPNKAVWNHWDKGRADAVQRIAATRLNFVKTAQRINGFKAWVLVAAMGGEVVAVVALTIAMGEVFKHG